MKEMFEEYCGCDKNGVVHAVFDMDEFNTHKVGRIRCSCGNIVYPCDACEDHSRCNNCPWKDSEITECMTDAEYFKWVKDNTMPR